MAKTTELIVEAKKLEHVGKLADAVARMEQAAAQARADPLLNIVLGELLARLGVLYERLGQLERAREVLEEALTTHTLAKGRVVLQVRSSLATIRLLEGERERGYQELRDVLDEQRAALPAQRVEIARTLNNLWGAARALGRPEEAEAYLRHAYHMLRVRVAQGHPLLATVLLNLVVAHREAGDIGAAWHYLDVARPSVVAAFGRDCREYVRLLREEAQLLSAQLRLQEALERAKEAVTAAARAFGTQHDEVAAACRAAGLLACDAGDHATALKYLEAAYRVFSALYGAQHVETVSTVLPIITASWKAGKLDDAEHNLDIVLGVVRRVGIKPQLFQLLTDRAGLLSAKKDHAGAADAAREAAAVFRILDTSHDASLRPYYEDLATIALRQGDGRLALDLLLRVATLDDRLVAQLASCRDESQRRIVGRSLAVGASAVVRAALAVPRDDEAAAGEAYVAVLARKGLLTIAAMAQDDERLMKLQPELATHIADIREIREQIVELEATGGDMENWGRERARAVVTEQAENTTPLAELGRMFHDIAEALEDDGKDDPDQLRSQLRQREAQVEALTRSENRPSLESRIDIAALAASLPPDSVLVDYYTVRSAVATNESDRALTAAERRGLDQILDPGLLAERYVAFVLPAGAPEDVRLVDLGDGATVAREVFSLLTVMNPGQIDLVPDAWQGTLLTGTETELSRVVRERLFDPLSKHLGEARTIIVAPDGVICRVAFGALVHPRDADLRLIDDYTFAYVTTARAMLGTQDPLQSPEAEALVVGDADYDLAPGTAKLDVENAAGAAGLHFDRLEGTRSEALAVANALGVRPMLGREANVAAVRQCRSPVVLHLATHGYFIRPFSQHLLVFGPWRQSGIGPLLRREVLGAAFNPFHRTGLALAGANAWSEGRANPDESGTGLLTALDVANMKLAGTELVVLSACSSALADVMAGQGMAGLLHAFHAAGARSVVAALWEIPDEETGALVTAFYEALRTGASRASALREAQLSMRRLGKDPWVWGGIICCGDHSPLRHRPAAWRSSPS